MISITVVKIPNLVDRFETASSLVKTYEKINNLPQRHQQYYKISFLYLFISNIKVGVQLQ